MLPLLLLSAAFAGPLAEPGERLPGAQVRERSLHAEFERYELELEDGEVLVVEVVAAGWGREGPCVAGGATLFPRYELRGEEAPELEDTQHPAVAELCRRLELSPPELRSPGAGDPADEVPAVQEDSTGPPSLILPPGPPRPRLQHGLWLVALLGGLAMGVRSRAHRGVMLALFALSLLLRLVLSPAWLSNGALAGFEKLIMARGLAAPDYMGGAWGALMGPLHLLFGARPQVVLHTNLVLASLSPPLLYAALRSLVARRAATLAAFMLAVLPAHLALSHSESMSVSILFCQLLALAATGALARGGGWLAGLIAGAATALAVSLRLEVLPFIMLPALWLALLRDRPLPRGPVILAAALALAGAALQLTVMPDPGDQQVLRWYKLLEVGTWVRALLPTLSAGSSFTRLDLTPAFLWPLAVLGLAGLREPRRRRVTLAALAWLALTLGAVAIKYWPQADLWRLHLPAQAAWLALSALGMQTLVRRWRSPRVPLVLGLAALPWLARVPGGWVNQQESAWLMDQVPQLPPDAVVLHDQSLQRAPAWAAVMETLGTARWRPASQPVDGALLYHGVSCQLAVSQQVQGAVPIAELPCARLFRQCHPQPLRTTVLRGDTDLDLGWSGELEVGFYRLDCGPGPVDLSDGEP